MKNKQWQVSVNVGQVEAASHEEAVQKAKAHLVTVAGDEGLHDVVRNAEPIVWAAAIPRPETIPA